MRIIIPDKKVFFCAISEFRPSTSKIWKIADSIFPGRKKNFRMGQKKFPKIFLLENVSKCQDLIF